MFDFISNAVTTVVDVAKVPIAVAGDTIVGVSRAVDGKETLTEKALRNIATDLENLIGNREKENR